jgi:hypothetical protein
MRRRAELHAVHEFDLDELLDALDLRARHESGELRCVICGRRTRSAGIGGLRRRRRQIEAACERLECLEGFGDQAE